MNFIWNIKNNKKYRTIKINLKILSIKKLKKMKDAINSEINELKLPVNNVIEQRPKIMNGKFKEILLSSTFHVIQNKIRSKPKPVKK